MPQDRRSVPGACCGTPGETSRRRKPMTGRLSGTASPDIVALRGAERLQGCVSWHPAPTRESTGAGGSGSRTGSLSSSSTRRCSRHTSRDSIDSSPTDDELLSGFKLIMMGQFERPGGRGCGVQEENRIKKLVDEITVSRENRPRPAGESVRRPCGSGMIGARTRRTSWSRDEVAWVSLAWTCLATRSTVGGS